MDREGILVGAYHALGNAARLLEDAALLYSAGRWPTSFHLAVMAREELGRFNILGKFANEMGNDTTTVTPSVVRKRVHPQSNAHHLKLKAGQSTFMLKTPLPEGTFIERQKLYEEMRNIDSEALHRKRQTAQYVDINDDETWSTPQNISDSEALQIIWIVSCEIGDSLLWAESDSECQDLLHRAKASLPRWDDFSARTKVLPVAQSSSDAQHAPELER